MQVIYSSQLFCPGGSPRFLCRSLHARCPLPPRGARRLLLPVASSPVPGFIILWQTGHPRLASRGRIRVRLRYGSRVRLARLRQRNYSRSRLLGSLSNGQFTRYPPFRILDRPGLSWRSQGAKVMGKNRNVCESFFTLDLRTSRPLRLWSARISLADLIF